MVKLVGRHCHVLGVAAVCAVSVVVRRQVNVTTLVGIQIEIQQPALPDTPGIAPLADRNDPTCHVSALNTRKRQRRRPTHGKRGNLLLALRRVEPFARFAVGVVFRRRRDLHQHLPRAGRWRGNVLTVLQSVDITVTGQEHRRHRGRNRCAVIRVGHGWFLVECICRDDNKRRARFKGANEGQHALDHDG